MIDIILFDISDDGRLNVHVQDKVLRGPIIDDVPDDDHLLRAICDGAGIAADDIIDIRHGVDYMSASGMSSSRFVQLRHVPSHNDLCENFVTAGHGLLPVDPQYVLRAARSGGDLRLEINIYHLMLDCDITPSGSLGSAILPGHHYIPMPETVSSLNGQLLKTPSPAFTEPVGVATVVPVIRDDRSGMVMIGLAIGESALGQVLTLPSYSLPPARASEALAAQFVACKIGVKSADLRLLGCAYNDLGNGDGSVRVLPYVVTRPSASMHQSAHFVTLRDAFFAGHYLRDADLMISVMRLTHALDLWPEFTQTRKPGYNPAIRL